MYTITPEDRCENCMHWLGDYHHKVYAKIAGTPTWVGQCIAIEEHDDAPYADLDNGAEAFVFTPPNGRCKCFEIHPDVAADIAADEAHYRQLDDGLRRDAWMGV